jgi:hypothetical protein
MTQNATIRLNGKQMRLVEEGLRNAFVDYPDLARLVVRQTSFDGQAEAQVVGRIGNPSSRTRQSKVDRPLALYELDERLNDIVVQQATFRAQVTQLIQWAEAKGKTKDLLLAAVQEVPGNARLRAAKEAVLGAGDLDDLEKIVSRNPALFSNPDAWRRAMIQAEWAVCRVERPEGRPLGTAFLVAADLVLTNYHVALDDRSGNFRTRPDSVRFRFGFREPADGAPEAGTNLRAGHGLGRPQQPRGPTRLRLPAALPPGR